jgi:hypothetical protein
MMNKYTALTIIFIVIVVFSSINVVNAIQMQNTVLNVPRNIVSYDYSPSEFENVTIPDDMGNLLRLLEEIKSIVEKYNATLAEEISDIELDILTGNYEEASIKYDNIKDDLQKLLDTIKYSNPGDYTRLLTLLPNDLINYLDLINEGDTQKFLSGELFTDWSIDIPPYVTESTPGGGVYPPTTLPSIGVPDLTTVSPTIYIPTIILLIIIPIMIILVVYKRDALSRLKKRMATYIGDVKKKIITKDELKDIDNKIIKNYYIFLSIMREEGYPKRDYEAPLEHIKRIEHEKYRDIGWKLTLLFEKVKYGLKEASKEEVIVSDELIKLLSGSEED